MKTKPGDLIRLRDDGEEEDELVWVPMYAAISSRMKTIGKFNSKCSGLVLQIKSDIIGYEYSRILSTDGKIGWVLNRSLEKIYEHR